MEKMKSFRNTRKVIKESSDWAMLARSKYLMHNEMVKREKKQILLSNGKWVTEFINCSYLGLDVKNEVVDAYKKGVDDLGIGFCAARTRLSTASNGHLEKSLSDLWEGHAIVFPSVTSTHHSVMPLISSGCFWQRENVRLIFDKFSHSSMQTLIPILSEEAEVVIICHNDIDALKVQIREAEKNNQLPVYVSDGIYSMGGHCPVNQIEELLENTDLHWYVDDAHGTSIYGKKGEGYILERLSRKNISKVVITFSLAKGFGATGGGVLVFSPEHEQLIRSFGQSYMFSAPMDYGAISAAIKIVEFHQNSEILNLRHALERNEKHFNRLMDLKEEGPIKMILVGDTERTLMLGEYLLYHDLLVSTIFFPVVPRNKSQLRICLSALHSEDEIERLAYHLKGGMKELGI